MPEIRGTKENRDQDQLGRDVYSPNVLVTLKFGDQQLPTNAVVDSGADSILVPAEVALQLGIEYTEITDGIKASGAGGPFQCRRKPGLTVSFMGCSFTDLLVVQPGALPVILLGRTDFFAAFDVRFEWYKTPPLFYLDPKREEPPSQAEQQAEPT
jgi:hypothetical protein